MNNDFTPKIREEIYALENAISILETLKDNFFNDSSPDFRIIMHKNNGRLTQMAENGIKHLEKLKGKV